MSTEEFEKLLELLKETATPLYTHLYSVASGKVTAELVLNIVVFIACVAVLVVVGYKYAMNNYEEDGPAIIFMVAGGTLSFIFLFMVIPNIIRLTVSREYEILSEIIKLVK